MKEKRDLSSTLFGVELPSRKPHVEAACQQEQCCKTASAVFATYCARFPNYLEKYCQRFEFEQQLTVGETEKVGNLQ